MDTSKRLLVLLDVNSLFYRAFYALPTTLVTKSGQITNAVYGFTAMLIKLFDEVGRPHAIGACLDRGKSFRDMKFEEYKAHRKPTPPELSEQHPFLRQVLDSLNICTIALEGYEADDLIATLAIRGEAEGWDVILVTGDRDSFQLISPNIKVMTTRRGITDIAIYDEAHLFERYGITPERVVDMMALKGDPSDNIPGVPGIGEKTAVKLVQEHGTVEQILDAAEGFTQKKLRENLITYRDQAILSKELATLHRDLPLDESIDELVWAGWNESEVRQVFGALEFRTLMERLFAMKGRLLEGAAQTPEAENQLAPSPAVQRISDDELHALVESFSSAKPNLGIEPIARTDKTLTGVIISDGSKCWQIDIDSDALFFSTDGLRKLCEQYSGIISFSDAKAALHIFSRTGIVQSPDKFLERVFDCGIAAYLVEPTATDYSLEQMASVHLGLTLPQLKSAQQNQLTDHDLSGTYSARAAALAALYPVLSARLESEELATLYKTIEFPLVRTLFDVEVAGIAVDKEYLRELSGRLDTRLAALSQSIYEDAGEQLNINSPQQLQEVLFVKLGLKSKKKTKTSLSTDASVLRELIDAHPIIPKILEYRELAKLKGTYLDGLMPLIEPASGRIHTTFNQKVAATGRLSSTDPNLQNIPIRTPLGNQIREAFVPGRGFDKLIVADYSQVELRIVAHLSGDSLLIDAFESGHDVHARTAAEVFGVPLEGVDKEMRRRAKAVNFGIVYGISAHGLAQQIKVPNEEAQAYIDRYFAKYTGVKDYIDNAIASAHRDGFVTTIFGRRRYLPELRSGNFRIRSFGERLAVNTPIQGSAADIIKIAMIRLHDRLLEEKLKSRMLLQVHDELVLETIEAEIDYVSKMVREVMAGAHPMRPPLLVDLATGPNWAKAK